MRTRTALAATVALMALPMPAASAVELCHVANAGFLIKGEKTSVLIDGLIREDQYDGRFALPSDAVLDAMMNRTGLFENLSIVLSTHRHGDHFDPKATIQNLRSTRSVQYGVPTDAVAALEANGLTDTERARLMIVEDGPQQEFTHAGVRIQTFDVDHGPNMPQNVGYRVTVDDVSFFHTGDISAARSQLSMAGLNALPVDVLIMPFWYGFQDAQQRQTIEESWAYGRIVPTHFNPASQAWMEQFGGLAGLKNSVKASFENAIINTTEGNCTAIE